MKISARKFLRLLLILHVIFISFQIPFRSIIFDTVYFRDIFLFASVGVWLLIVFKDNNKQHFNFLDLLFIGYLGYGFLVLFFNSINDLSLMDNVVKFRSFFWPAILFFVAKKAYVSSSEHRNFSKMLIYISLIYCLDVLVEFTLISFGVSRHSIPWYRYTFENSYYYIGNNTDFPGVYDPEKSPLLGFLGSQHATAATLMALFAFSFPFIFQNNANYNINIVKKISKSLFKKAYVILPLFVIVAITVLGVKTHMISFIIITICFPFLAGKKYLSKTLLLIFIIFLIFSCVSEFREMGLSRVNTILFGYGEDADVSAISSIFNKEAFAFLSKFSISLLLFGSSQIVDSFMEGAFEIRLFYWTAAYGLVWLSLLSTIFILGIMYSNKLRIKYPGNDLESLFAIGIINILIVYSIDMFHYARLLYAPNIDFLSLSMGVLSVMHDKNIQCRNTAHCAWVKSSI